MSKSDEEIIKKPDYYAIVLLSANDQTPHIVPLKWIEGLTPRVINLNLIKSGFNYLIYYSKDKINEPKFARRLHKSKFVDGEEGVYKGHVIQAFDITDDIAYNKIQSEYPELFKSASKEESPKRTATERNEDKLKQALENVLEQSAETRTEALKTICDILSNRYMPDFVDGRKLTLIECIEKSLRRGKDAEQIWAAKLAPLLVIQLGGNEIIPEFVNQLLITKTLDNSVSFEVRANCCMALGLLGFLSGDLVSDLLSSMRHFEKIFLQGYEQSSDVISLQAEALTAWGYLFTLIPSSDFVTLVNSGELPSIEKMSALLESPILDVRAAAGLTIALMLESARADDENFSIDALPELIQVIQTLATNTSKYHTKQDLKEQRAVFRDILKYLEDETTPELKINLRNESPREYLTLDSWASQHQYKALCAIVGPGIISHLRNNQFIRKSLDFGEKILAEDHGFFYSKHNIYNKNDRSNALKSRTQNRANKRDNKFADNEC